MKTNVVLLTILTLFSQVAFAQDNASTYLLGHTESVSSLSFSPDAQSTGKWE